MRALTLSLPRAALALCALASGIALTPGEPRAQPANVYCGGYGDLVAANVSESQGCPTPPEIDASLRQIVGDRIRHLVTHTRLASPLLGATEQINCGDCFRGFVIAGSFSAGFNGRKNVTDRLSVLGGLSYSESDSKSSKTTRAPIFALGLRYDLADWGWSRPFFEVAGSLAPGERVRTTRVVNAGGFPGVLTGATDAATYAMNARAGWVWRVSPVGELAAYVNVAHTGQRQGAYTERGDPLMLPLTYDTKRSSLNVVKAVVQHTQLLTSAIELHVGAGLAHSFGADAGVGAVTSQPFYGVFTGAAKNSTWAEVDARLGYRLGKGMVLDAFALTTLGPRPVGNTIHGGLGLRYLF